MLTLMLAQIFLEAFVLCIILYLVAKHEADYSFAKVAMVTGAVTAGSAIIEALAGEKLGPFTAIPVLAFIAFMLMTFCWITLKKSILVVLLFCTFHLLVGMGLNALHRSLTTGAPVPGPVSDEDVEVAVKFFEEVYGEAPAAMRPPQTHPPQASTEPALKTATRDHAPRIPQETGRTKALPAVDQEKWDAARKTLRIGGIMAGARGTHVAMVNNQPVEEGDSVSAIHEGKTYHWRVRSIGKTGLELDPIAVSAR